MPKTNSQCPKKTFQLLPKNNEGGVLYCPNFLTKTEAAQYFEQLENEIFWETEVVKMFGKTHHLTRETAWFADDGATYSYAGSLKKARPWNAVMLDLKQKTECFVGQEFNSCLANFYPDGGSGMSWHSDDEPEIDQAASIASLSFGAERKFSLKHKRTKEKRHVQLISGSLLEMQANTQQYWLHSLPKTKKSNSPRINLTFRKLNKDS